MPGFGPTLTYYSTLALRPDPPLSFAWNQDRRIWSELLSRCGCAPPLAGPKESGACTPPLQSAHSGSQALCHTAERR